MKQSEITTRSAKIVFEHLDKEKMKAEAKGWFKKLAIDMLYLFISQLVYKFMNIAQVKQLEEIGESVESDVSSFETHLP